jgi:release factor glutamine methyltransferase
MAGAGAGVPVRDALDSAVVAISASGSPTARLDAELLLAAALGVDRTALWTTDADVAGGAVRTFRDLVRRRAVGHEPVAYLLGTKGFRWIDLAVDPRVLIPRPETELLVEVGLELPDGARVVDVGTGSGAIALALKHERPDLVVTGTDVSPDALAVARANGARLGLDVTWLEGDLLAGVAEADAIVSNPPYVQGGARVPPELGFEPELALLAGPTGLEVYERLAPAAAATGAQFAAFEVGDGQASNVADLLRAAGWERIAVVPDLAGIERVVVARR